MFVLMLLSWFLFTMNLVCNIVNVTNKTCMFKFHKKVDFCIQKIKTMEVTLDYLLLHICFMFIGFLCHLKICKSKLVKSICMKQQYSQIKQVQIQNTARSDHGGKICTSKAQTAFTFVKNWRLGYQHLKQSSSAYSKQR